MKTKNIIGALAMALLMPAMLLTACSNDKEVTPTIDDNTAKKGYPLQVTINVTRDGDEAPAGSSKIARAHYNGDTKKLEFTEGDKLFVKCYETGAGWFAGTLNWISGGTFSGTITTQKEYSGTADELFTAAKNVYAALLPADYETYEYFSITKKSGYDAELEVDYAKAFATATTEKTAKAIAIEQFSAEVAYAYSDGIALEPQMAILNFTITGLTANTNVTATLTHSDSEVISGTVPTNASGEATFAMGVVGGSYNINQLTLTVDNNVITFTNKNKKLEAGKVYNITRSAVPAEGHSLPSSAVGEVVGTDGLAYNAADRNNLPTGVTPAGVVAYKSGDNGLVLALEDKGSMGWSDAVGAGGASAYTPTVTDHSWELPSQSEWRQMFYANGGSETEYPGLNTILVNAGGSGLNVSVNYTDYWTSDEYGSYNAYYFSLYDGQYVWFRDNAKTKGCYVRACFSF